MLPALANSNIEHLFPFNEGKGNTVEQEINYIHKFNVGDALEL